MPICYVIRKPTKTNNERNTPAPYWPLAGIARACTRREAAALYAGDDAIDLVNAGKDWSLYHGRMCGPIFVQMRPR